jgi:uncharacterized protein
MNDTTNICLACGYCCDGTIIGFVQVDADELPAISALKEIEVANEGGFFLQPCTNYCEGCGIYADRPKQCAHFKCGLLKSVEANELDFELAVAVIDEVKHRKDAIEKRLAGMDLELQSQSFYFKMIELKRLLLLSKAISPATQDHEELMTAIDQLDSLMAEKFGTSLF